MSLDNRAEQRAERFFYMMMGTLRARYLATETLSAMMEGWDGEYAVRDIPASAIQAELEYRRIAVSVKQ